LRRSMCVMLGTETVIAAHLRAVIPSGRLMVVLPSAADAMELLHKLKAAPAAPCGP
jgi:hypothetical protein